MAFDGKSDCVVLHPRVSGGMPEEPAHGLRIERDGGEVVPIAPPVVAAHEVGLAEAIDDQNIGPEEVHVGFDG